MTRCFAIYIYILLFLWLCVYQRTVITGFWLAQQTFWYTLSLYKMEYISIILIQTWQPISIVKMDSSSQNNLGEKLIGHEKQVNQITQILDMGLAFPDRKNIARTILLYGSSGNIERLNLILIFNKLCSFNIWYYI